MRLARRSLLLLATPALAQMRALRIIVPFAPGGPSDTLARIFAEKLGEILGQTVVVENRSGAGSTVGSEAAARAMPDGQTLLFNNISHATNRAFFRALAFDPLTDFAPVAALAESPVVLLGAPNLEQRSLPEFLAAVAARPGHFAYGSAGNGTAAHLAVAKLLAAAGLSMTHVPYRGVAPAMNDLAAGVIAMVGDTATTGLGQARGGVLRAFGVTSAARMPQAPDLPTVRETGVAGLADYAMTSWNVLLAPRGTPDAAIQRLEQAVRAAKADAPFAARLLNLGNTLMPNLPPAALAAFLAAEQTRWAEVLATAGIRPE